MQAIEHLFGRDTRTIPSELRTELWQEFFLYSHSRGQDVMRFLAVLYAMMILVVDVINVVNLNPTARLGAFIAHSVMIIFLLGSLWTGKRFVPKHAAGMNTRHVVFVYVHSLVILALANSLLYLISMQHLNPVAIYIAIVLIWSIGLVCNPTFGWIQLAVNFGAGMTIIARTGNIEIYHPQTWLVCSMSTIAAGISTHLNFATFKREFLQRKEIESERTRIATLNEEIAVAYEEAESLNTNLVQTLHALEEEQRRSEELLLNVLPAPIAERLKSGETLIADLHHEATILFADIVGFTKLSAETSAVEIVQMLNWVFSIFDRLTEVYGLEKIKTIADAYMVVGGVPEERTDHAEAVVALGLAMLGEVERFAQESGIKLAVRIGVHTGAVVAGVIGQKKFVYDLWGDTVNTASRMESHGEAGKVHISEAVFVALQHSDSLRFNLEERGEIDIKGKGAMRTWFVMR